MPLKDRKKRCTVILSFLKREREFTVNAILQSFLTVYLVQYDRFIPFTVPDRYFDRSWPFQSVSKRFRNGQERSWLRPGTLKGQERLGNFES